MESAHSNSNPGILTYFLSSKKSILIISLVGPITRAGSAVLEKCIVEVSKTDAQFVVINFRDVSKEIDRHAYPALVRLQKIVRDRHAELKLSGMHPDLVELLGESGLIRGNELCMNLTQALQSFSFNRVRDETAAPATGPIIRGSKH
ncbi:MAG: STAS domain-containing protein [Bdellovibrionota bacterium]